MRSESRSIYGSFRRRNADVLTKKNERLRFPLMPARPKPRTKADVGAKSPRTWVCWL